MTVQWVIIIILQSESQFTIFPELIQKVTFITHLLYKSRCTNTKQVVPSLLVVLLASSNGRLKSIIIDRVEYVMLLGGICVYRFYLSNYVAVNSLGTRQYQQ